MICYKNIPWLNVILLLTPSPIAFSFIPLSKTITNHNTIQQQNQNKLHLPIRQMSFFDNDQKTTKIPKSSNERDNLAIKSIQAAIKSPRTSSFPLIECEFPPLASLNKLGDGSLRSTREVEEANLSFAIKLLKSISSPLQQLITSSTPRGKNNWLLMSSASSKSYLEKAKSRVGKNAAIKVQSLKDGIPNDICKNDICIFLTPSTSMDYSTARALSSSDDNVKSVVINGYAKDAKSIPEGATMAYYLKPLTYNSQIAGYLTRTYPKNWMTLDAESSKLLSSVGDVDILVKGTNTPDLRKSVSLVSKFVSDRAIQLRKQLK